MGGIGDYAGALVFELPLDCAAWVGLQERGDGRFVVRSRGAGEEHGDVRAEFDVSRLVKKGIPLENDRLRDILHEDQSMSWSAYVLGPILLAARTWQIPLEKGLSLAVDSDVPLGAGVSSSAALEVASLTAALSYWDRQEDGLEQSSLCQQAENHIAGAPCGIMDQVTCIHGKANHFLALLCQPHDIIGHYAIPPGIAFSAIHSGVKHAVGGSRYTDTRIGVFMGHRIIAWHASEGGNKKDPFGGYLANITPDQFKQEYEMFLPSRMKGADFLAKYGPTCDKATVIDPDKTYAIRSRAAHPVYENQRVFQFLSQMVQAAGEPHDLYLESAGELMYHSHWSYSKRCGLGCAETDLIVKLVRDRGAKRGFFGAKITGGGSGGSVAIMARTESRGEIYEIAEEYERLSGRKSRVLEGSSSGALEMGTAIV